MVLGTEHSPRARSAQTSPIRLASTSFFGSPCPGRRAHFRAAGGQRARLNVHFHTLALDGAIARDNAGRLQFHEFGEPTAEDVAQVAAWTHASLLRVLKRHGLSPDDIETAPDTFVSDQPVLASATERRRPLSNF